MRSRARNAPGGSSIVGMSLGSSRREVRSLGAVIHPNDAVRERLFPGHRIGLAAAQGSRDFLQFLGQSVGREPEVALDELVREAHHLSIDLFGRLGNSDVVAEALA